MLRNWLKFILQTVDLISQIVTPEEIYNEFSGGIPDIAAIRNFVRMKYLKQNWDQKSTEISSAFR